MKTLICTHGITASGKTSIAKFISKNLGLEYISEASLKQELKSDFSVYDCLDENLRDIAYLKAMNIAQLHLDKSRTPIIDASFHLKRRRELLYSKFIDTVDLFVFIHTKCRNFDKNINRIQSRKLSVKNSENHADDFIVYNYISNNFEEINPDEINGKNNLAIFNINTDIETIESIVCIPPNIRQNVENINIIIDKYLRALTKAIRNAGNSNK